jgi:hypothetical protein
MSSIIQLPTARSLTMKQCRSSELLEGLDKVEDAQQSEDIHSVRVINHRTFFQSFIL